MYKIKPLLLTITFSALILMSPQAADAQSFKLFGKKETKKVLKFQRDSLQKALDSLKGIINDGEIALADTTDMSDTINIGAFNYLDNEDFANVDPGCNTDSLLSVWYAQRSTKLGDCMGIDQEMAINLDSIQLSSNIPDSQYIENLKKMNSFIPIPYNDIVRKYIILYTEKMPHKAARILGLSNYFLPIFEEIFDFYGIPKEIKALAIIESALNPIAHSPMNARGIWQFMYRTGLQYNLKINSYVDERLDPIAATHAAAKYLRDAYIIFGDWALAISSYNCGSGNVNKAIRRAGSKEFWSIYPYLPKETRGYIPAFVGALYLLNYYKDYNIIPDKCPIPAHLDTFNIKQNLHFEQISENIGISLNELRYYNPQYTQDVVPGNEAEYTLKLPYNYTVAFVEKEQEIYHYKDSVYFNPIVYNKLKESRQIPQNTIIYHKVKSGETLSKIASKHKVQLADLRKWNKLSSKSIIRPGQKLAIHTKGGVNYVQQENYNTYTPSKSSKSNSSSKGGYIYYTIKKGDTLLGIAHKHPGVSLDDILKINGLTKKSKIFPGKKIKIRNT